MLFISYRRGQCDPRTAMLAKAVSRRRLHWHEGVPTPRETASHRAGGQTVISDRRNQSSFVRRSNPGARYSAGVLP
jgi:hypothetical protein